MKTKKEMPPHCSEKTPATFCDIAACFSEEEWKLLHEWQKDLYRNLMKEIHQVLISLGPVIATTVFSLRIKGKEQICPSDQQESERKPSDSNSPSHVTTTPVLSITKQKEHLYSSNYQEYERRRRNNNSPRVSSPNIETEETFMDHCGSGREASSTSLCPDVGTSVVHTEQHLESSLENKSMTSECERSFRIKSNVNNRYRIKPEETLHACTEYSGSMAEQSNAITHKDNQQECSQHTKTELGMSFSDSANLNSPPKMSTTLEMYICGLCGNCFNQPADKTLYHQNAKGEPQNICVECEKSLQQSTNLHSDQGNNTGGKPYPCRDCGKSFRKSQSLIIHQRVHTGEKPYTCSQCGKHFRQLPHLVKHQRLHTGEKPYICNVCERRFIDSSNLKRHEQIHIRELDIMTWPTEG